MISQKIFPSHNKNLIVHEINAREEAFIIFGKKRVPSFDKTKIKRN